MFIMNQEQFINLVCSKVDINYLTDIYTSHISSSRNKGQGIPLNGNVQLINYIKKSYEDFLDFTKTFMVKNESILEIGSGFGGFVLLSLLHGIDTTGIEPETKMVWIAEQMLKSFGFNSDSVQCSQGEELPFNNDSFDFVVSFQVLEHVEKPKKVLDESIRVLKPKGLTYFVFPNYNSFYEGHIEKIWFPFINKKNEKLYLKLLGADEGKLKYVNFLTPRIIKEYLREYNEKIEIISLGEKEFIEKYFSNNYIKKIKSKALKLIFKSIYIFKLNNVISKTLIYLQWYYPIVLIVKKVTPSATFKS